MLVKVQSWKGAGRQVAGNRCSWVTDYGDIRLSWFSLPQAKISEGRQALTLQLTCTKGHESSPQHVIGVVFGVATPKALKLSAIWLPVKHVTCAKITEIALGIQYYLSPERNADSLIVFFDISDSRPEHKKI